MTAVAWLHHVLDWSCTEALVCLAGGLLLMLGGFRESLHIHGPAGPSAWLLSMVSCLIVHVLLVPVSCIIAQGPGIPSDASAANTR